MRAAVAAGVDLIQVREPDLPDQVLLEVVTRCAYKRKKRPCGIPDVLVPDPKELKGTEALAGLMDHNRQFKGRGGKG